MTDQKRRERIVEKLIMQSAWGNEYEVAADWIIKLQDALRECQRFDNCGCVGEDASACVYCDPDYGLTDEESEK